jgi:hypothetical protein
MARSDRPNARVSTVHIAGIHPPPGGARSSGDSLLMDCPNGLRPGAIVYVWSVKWRRWIACEVLPRSGQYYCDVTEVKIAK